MQLRAIGILLSCCLCAAFLQAQDTNAGSERRFGDDTLAIGINGRTGAWVALYYQGRKIARGQDGAGFDLQQTDHSWLSQSAATPELLTLASDSPQQLRTEQRLGLWRVICHYELLPAKTQLKRSVDIIWEGDNDSKIRSFVLNSPTLPFSAPGYYFQPGDFPPRQRLASELTPGRRQGNGRSPWPTLVELSPKLSLVWLMDSLAPQADNGSSVVNEEADALRVAMHSSCAGHVQPGAPQHLGDFWLWLQDNDGETALLRLPEWFRDRDQVPPRDRPSWVPRATLYSFHPGGSTGSGWQDWGGFGPSTAQLPRIAELGCNALWLLPLEDLSPYHPRDYYKFMAGIGSADDYRQLLSKAKELDMRVWQDIVPHGGSNTYQRAIEHPEWLLQEEDGSTLGYWCFDFNWPSWIDYMRDVARHYVREYGIDGYRIDACGGSKIFNWNPAIPYARASLSRSQGGFAMQRAIREGVREHNEQGSTLAEAGGGQFAAVSDAIYDFAMCYSVFPALRAGEPHSFVANLRRWLHEQQYSNVPELIGLRHIESHDSLRAERQYGPAPMRAALAATAWIKGIPMLYQDNEDGHGPLIKKIFALRNALYEQDTPSVDYLAVAAPAGVFACLRQAELPAQPGAAFAWEKRGGWRASVALVNFNPEETSGSVTLPLSALPAPLRQATRCRDLWSGQELALRPSADAQALVCQLRLPPFGMAMLRLGSLEQPPMPSSKLNPAAQLLPYELQLIDQLGQAQPLRDALDKDGQFQHQSREQRWLITQERLADGTLQITATAPLADSEPSGLLLRVPVAADTPCYWRAQAAAGVWEDRFRTRHPLCDGVKRTIYYHLQGGNVLWNSLQNPFGFGEQEGQLAFYSAQGSLELSFPADAQPALACILDRVEDDHSPHIFMRWGLDDDTVGNSVRSFRFRLRQMSPSKAEAFGSGDPRLLPIAGGWLFDNAKLRLRISNSGIINSHEVRGADGQWQQLAGGYQLYSDAGYGEEGMRYRAFDDVESFARFSREQDGSLRLAFSGTMRGRGRFELMQLPLDYATEYTLDDSDTFGFAWAVRARNASQGKRVFVAMQQRLNECASIEFLHGGKIIASGQASKQREAETKKLSNAPLPDAIVLRDHNGAARMHYAQLHWEGQRPENLFIHDHAMYLAWHDGDKADAEVGQWRRASAWIAPGDSRATHAATAIPGLQLPALAAAELGLLSDPGFEHSSLSSWYRRTVQLQGRTSSWRVPAGGGLCSDRVRSGQAAACVVGADGEYRLFSQALSTKPFKAGETWRLSCWARGEDIVPGKDGWMAAIIRFAAQEKQDDGRSSTRYGETKMPMGSFAWQQFVVEWMVPDNLASLSVQAGLNGNKGRLWLDDLQLERIKQGKGD
jgi:glycosidase